MATVRIFGNFPRAPLVQMRAVVNGYPVESTFPYFPINNTSIVEYKSVFTLGSLWFNQPVRLVLSRGKEKVDLGSGYFFAFIPIESKNVTLTAYAVFSLPGPGECSIVSEILTYNPFDGEIQNSGVLDIFDPY